MTYVREQTSAELAAHMRRLQAMPGWFEPLADRLWQEVQSLQRDNAELTAARIAYASEFAPNADGEPDVGNIHANIRAMKAELFEAGDEVEKLERALADCRDDCGEIARMNDDLLMCAVSDPFSVPAFVAEAIRLLNADNAALMEDAAVQIQIAREAVERTAGLEAQLEIPDYAMPPDGQEWALVGSAVAYHLIERHAENWAHAGQLMEAWRDATVFVADHAVAKDAERYRHLRDCNGGSLIIVQITGMGDDDQVVLTEADADSAIDAAIKRTSHERMATD